MEPVPPLQSYTIPEAAVILGISRIAVFRRIKRGSLPAERKGRSYTIRGDDLTSLVEASSARRYPHVLHRTGQRSGDTVNVSPLFPAIVVDTRRRPASAGLHASIPPLGSDKRYTIKKLYPHLTDKQAEEAEEAFDRYLDLVHRAYERIQTDPGLRAVREKLAAQAKASLNDHTPPSGGVCERLPTTDSPENPAA